MTSTKSRNSFGSSFGSNGTPNSRNPLGYGSGSYLVPKPQTTREIVAQRIEALRASGVVVTIAHREQVEELVDAAVEYLTAQDKPVASKPEEDAGQ